VLGSGTSNAILSRPEFEQAPHLPVIIDRHMQIDARGKQAGMAYTRTDLSRRSVILPSFAAVHGLRVSWIQKQNYKVKINRQNWKSNPIHG
jgi:hypothetical protein